MKENEKKQVIVSARDDQTMWSTTRVLLVLTFLDEEVILLHEGSYEYLAESSDYWDDDKEDFFFPPEINGKKVHGVEEGYLVGGEIEMGADSLNVVLVKPEEIEAWLRDRSWHDKNFVNEILEMSRPHSAPR